MLRSRYREIEKVKGRMYPLERDYTIAESKGQDEPTMIIGMEQNPLYEKIIEVGQRTKTAPFLSAISKF